MQKVKPQFRQKLNLSYVRKSQGKTQEQLGEVLNKNQSQISCFERATNHKISSLREYAKALGGKIEFVFVFEDKEIIMEL